MAKSSQRLHQGWLFFHIFFLPSVIAHTGIGIYRIAVKYGFCVKARRDVWRRRLWIGMGCYLLLGVLALSRVWCQG